MAIVAILYLLLVWLIFAKLRWLRWGWGTGTATVLVGLFVAALFAGFLNYLAPTGRVVVISRVVEVTPNVSGHDRSHLAWLDRWNRQYRKIATKSRIPEERSDCSVRWLPQRSLRQLRDRAKRGRGEPSSVRFAAERCDLAGVLP
jgi:hypothetical protein